MSESFKTTVDPLLKDVDGKKESFRRNVVSMAAEIKQFLEEVDDLRSQIALTKETAEASAASAQSTQLQCSMISQQLDDKTRSLREHQDRVTHLSHQFDNLQRDLRTRECSQKQLRDEVIRIEREITEAVAKSGKDMECEIRKLVEENFCPFGDSCRYLHPNNIPGNTGYTNNNSNTQLLAGLPNQHIQGSDCFSGRAGGTGWFDLPPSLRPPPEQGYPQLPSIDWG
ncbi:hypothetical protein F2Q69_00039817 [Brassica cretica]|uniref:C3H1-type domain-containing protein n=1 Tax=Brassica cretica TaxID=69181 RepID=A0A8S9NBW3_BRACR|nr:hypothetical protein F2Q69_00039817 [Brassica cretica]